MWWIIAILAAASLGRKASSKGNPSIPAGRVWSSGGSALEFQDFDFGSNRVKVTPGCSAVAEGDYFWPEREVGTRERASSLTETLSISPENTALGFVDHLVFDGGVTNPAEVAMRIVAEVAPECPVSDIDQWSAAMQQWYGSLVRRVVSYMAQEATG